MPPSRNKKVHTKRPFRLKKVSLKVAYSAFGLASHPYEVELTPGFDERVAVEIPLDTRLCAAREVNPATIRVFRWDPKVERFRIVEDSRIGERWTHAVAHLHEPGVYVAAGESSNRWVYSAMTVFRTFGGALFDPDVGPVIRRILCPVLLCPGMLGNVLEHVDPARFNLPLTPGPDFCEICLGGGLGHAVDLYPRWPDGRDCPCNLTDYLDAHPEIAARIIWRDPAIRSYREWTPDEKSQLAANFETIRLGGLVGLPEVALSHPPGPGEIHTRYSRETAWQAFVAHVAQTLVVDACRWVNWSITGFSDDALRLLLDSTAMFRWTAGGDYEHDGGAASHGDPTRVYRWLRSEGLIADTQLATVGRVIEWCRDNLAHFVGYFTADNMFDHWQYRGYPPVERIIAGTTSSYGFNHWTAGCWGTSGFLELVLRTINVPATFAATCGHSQPYFPTLGRYLSHGDDPYNRATRAAGIAGLDLLIDQAQFDEWFRPDNPDRCSNVGRRVRELTGT